MTDRRGFLKLAGATAATASVGLPTAAAASRAPQCLLYIGSYAHAITTVGSEDLGTVSEATGLAAPSYLADHPNGRFVYAVDEQEAGTVTGFAKGRTGKLSQLNTQPVNGKGPAQLTVDPTGRYVVTANYGSGSVSVNPLNADGTVGAVTDVVQHQGASPHAHMVRFAPSGRFALVADLGTDEIFAYQLRNGKLVQTAVTKVPTGTGPRHFRFAPHDTVYLVGESDSTLRTYTYDQRTGALTERNVQPATKETYSDRNYPSEIALSPDNAFAYVANRGGDVITTFDVRGATPKVLADVSVHGHWPRHFAVTGNRIWVANQLSNNLVEFSRDPRTGLPTFSTQRDLTTPSFVLPAR
ncbi:lactonase family protein [Fodinicola acaciae]|uniref:lactonase family protein n=1 Tax=Fodinicola acaciae TaxID=2681555 RepID=UPI0013D78A9C|nr:lactonase family protein [Fodinicola acaciae]